MVIDLCRTAGNHTQLHHHVLVVNLSRRNLIEALRRSLTPLESWALASQLAVPELLICDVL
ncbi:hypothetical protein [Streptomyces roseifaciens]|uniref:hypothetical protein n=1 Tax=Streptomyces roseifaciens TaxID=1488406 RepID=UPI000718011D|nr:hypothetical protein [Streptomyces roseifaciens]